MTDVLIDGGRIYEADVLGRTADAVAAEVAAAVLDVNDSQTFSLKVDGHVLRPGATVDAGEVVELVEVTGYVWPEDRVKEIEGDGIEKTGIEVELGETGEIVGDGSGEALPPIEEAPPARRRGARGADTADDNVLDES